MSVVGRITFSHIRDVISGLGKHTRPPLGRWLLKKDNQIATTVRYANEDHCGTCVIPENTQHFETYTHKEDSLLEIEYECISINTQH
jgi:hypothetical protein